MAVTGGSAGGPHGKGVVDRGPFPGDPPKLEGCPILPKTGLRGASGTVVRIPYTPVHCFGFHVYPISFDDRLWSLLVTRRIPAWSLSDGIPSDSDQEGIRLEQVKRESVWNGLKGVPSDEIPSDLLQTGFCLPLIRRYPFRTGLNRIPSHANRVDGPVVSCPSAWGRFS